MHLDVARGLVGARRDGAARAVGARGGSEGADVAHTLVMTRSSRRVPRGSEGGVGGVQGVGGAPGGGGQVLACLRAAGEESPGRTGCQSFCRWLAST